MYELVVEGQVKGIFSSIEKSKEFAEEKYNQFAILPFGTYMYSDMKEKQEVVITVSGGVAEVFDCPSNIKVRIVDYDNLKN